MGRKAYILSFDRDDSVDYKDFHTKLTSLPEILNWSHYIKSSYILISSELNATVLNKKIVDLFEPNVSKSWLLIEANLNNKNGRLVQKAWDWLNLQKSKLQ